MAPAGDGRYLESLDVLLLSFAVGFVVAIVVSLYDAASASASGAAGELNQRSHTGTMKPSDQPADREHWIAARTAQLCGRAH